MEESLDIILHCNYNEPKTFKESIIVYHDLIRGLEFLKSILSALPDEISIINTKKEIIWSNKNELKKLPLNKLDNFFSNMTFKDGCPLDYVFLNKNTINFETKIENKNYLNIITPCNYNGHVSTILYLRRDITETKRIEEFKQLEFLINEVVKSQEALTQSLLKKD